MKVIDLFAGCGGLSLGFAQEGHTIARAVEFDPPIAHTYKQNFPEVEVVVDDIQNINPATTLSPGAADVIIGGPPCQGFSMAGARIRQGFIDDPRNYLFKHYFRVVKRVKPKVFVMENVKGMRTMQGGEIFREIHNIFSSAERLGGEPYHLFSRMVSAVEFGIPQKRERFLIIGTTLENVAFEPLWEAARAALLQEIPTYFDAVTVRDAIGNLPAVTKLGQVVNPAPQTAYERYLASNSSTICNHTQSKHSDLAVDRMKRVKSGENYAVLGEAIKSVHSGSYGRLKWDEPASTITTRFDTPAGGRFIHPSQDRTLTPREAARLQSFPDDFVFYGNKRCISKQIGNAVPPKISRFLARLIAILLREHAQ